MSIKIVHQFGLNFFLDNNEDGESDESESEIETLNSMNLLNAIVLFIVINMIQKMNTVVNMTTQNSFKIC